MTTPYDDLPIEVRRERWGWFGLPWWSFVCYDEGGKLVEEMRKPFPVGESCLYCREQFDEAAGDSGQAVPAITTAGAEICHVHKECQFRQVAGGLAHHEDRCRCHGGVYGCRPEGGYLTDAEGYRLIAESLRIGGGSHPGSGAGEVDAAMAREEVRAAVERIMARGPAGELRRAEEQVPAAFRRPGAGGHDGSRRG